MKNIKYTFLICLLYCSGYGQNIGEPDPIMNPESTLMLMGDWFDHPHDINFDLLPKIPYEHAVVSNVQGDKNSSEYTFSGHTLKGGLINTII